MTRPDFIPLPIKSWKGRYARVPATKSALHLRRINGAWWPVVEWPIGDETAECPLVYSPAAEQLSTAVFIAKRRSGGAFQINEFGQVIVPVSDIDDKCRLVGEWHGPLVFENSFQPGNRFDLCDDRGLAAGSEWKRPYVGIPHRFGSDGKICFVHDGPRGSRKNFPPEQDTGLVRALRNLRGASGARFLVAPAGIVLTKMPPREADAGNEDTWKPVYVGRVNPKRWFDKVS